MIYTNFDGIKFSFSKQFSDSAQDTILLWVVRVVLAGDFEYSWECVCEGID